MRIVILVLASFAAIPLVLDEAFIGYPPPWWSYPVVALLFAAGLFRRCPLAHQRRSLFAFVAVGLCLLVIHLVPWPTRDPFFADLFSIKRGMTPAEVRKVMARHKEGTGWPANPLDPSTKDGEFTIAGALVFRPASAGPGDADWGIVHFERGRVTSVEFSPD
jgi:hypothetical protein